MTRLKVTLVYGLAVGMAVFHLYAGYFGQPEAQMFRSTHVGFAMCLVFLLFPPGAVPARAGLSDTDLAGGLVIALHVYILRDPGAVAPHRLTRRISRWGPVRPCAAGRGAPSAGDGSGGGRLHPQCGLRQLVTGILWPTHGGGGDQRCYGTTVSSGSHRRLSSYIVLFIIFGSSSRSRGRWTFMTLALPSRARRVGGPPGRGGRRRPGGDLPAARWPTWSARARSRSRS